MHVKILGSGTMLSPASRNPSGYLVRHNGHRILLDAGPGILRRLNEYGVPLLELDGILLSHFHLDHCADVFPILMKRHLMQADANKDFFVGGSAGIFQWFDRMARWQGRWLHQDFPEVIDLTVQDFTCEECHITTAHAEHTTDSIAIRIAGDQTIFFSGDSDFSEHLVSLAWRANLGIVECSHPDSMKMPGHMTVSETGQLAQKAGIEHLVATHIYPDNDTPDLEAQLSRTYGGKITIASDGLDLNV